MTAPRSERLQTTHIPTPAVEQRGPIRAEIDRQTKIYLARGGIVAQIGAGVIAKADYSPYGRTDTAEDKAARGARSGEQTKLTNRQKAVKI